MQQHQCAKFWNDKRMQIVLICFTVKKVVHAKVFYILLQKPPTTLMFNLLLQCQRKMLSNFDAVFPTIFSKARLLLSVWEHRLLRGGSAFIDYFLTSMNFQT